MVSVKPETSNFESIRNGSKNCYKRMGGRLESKTRSHSALASAELEASDVEAITLVQCNKSQQRLFLGDGSR